MTLSSNWSKDFFNAFEQSSSGQSLVNMMELDLLVGSGGVLSHAPRRQQSARMLIDSFMPEGITQLAVDSIFMMPQLGVLANIDKEELKDDASQAALEVFDNDCLIRLGTCVTPVGSIKPNSKMADVTLTFNDGTVKDLVINEGTLEMMEYPYEEVKISIKPVRGIDVGAGKGEALDSVIYGGVVGLIFDGRNRPITLSKESNKRIDSLLSWSKAVDEYPKGEVF